MMRTAEWHQPRPRLSRRIARRGHIHLNRQFLDRINPKQGLFIYDHNCQKYRTGSVERKFHFINIFLV